MAIITRAGIAVRVLFKMATRTSQAIVARVGHLKVATVYISLLADRDEYDTYLGNLHKYCRGQAVIMGDFNARHRHWDRKSNWRGNKVARGAEKHNWRIRTATGPTFDTTLTFSLQNH